MEWLGDLMPCALHAVLHFVRSKSSLQENVKIHNWSELTPDRFQWS